MKELNEHLKSSVVINQIEYISLETRKCIPIKVLSKAYTTIAELIEEYNNIIGFPSLFFCGTMLLNMLVPINMALLFVYHIPINANHTFGIPFVIYCVLWLIFPIVFGLELFAACDVVEKEVAKVPQICHSLIKRLGNNEFKLKNELNDYATQANQVKPKFTAAGYFDINLGLTMPMFGSVFTYVIVLLQFKDLQ
ncbi:gustatory receptor 68a-like [Atheta coriaria]|uniref:gustatory receptor 68a-like n=1 Tax=Dalotia coriaria TaxID=877792 RepID=UPI0031F3B133